MDFAFDDLKMDITLDDLTLLIEELKKNNATQLCINIKLGWCDVLESIDFDIWKDEKFVKTALTKIRWQKRES